MARLFYFANHQIIEMDAYTDGSEEYFTYDKAGRLLAYIDGKGNQTQYRYSLDDLPIERINALNHRFQYEYDKARRLVKLTNENQASYHFVYDEMNRLQEEVSFDKRKTTYRYNAQGELESQQQFGTSATPQVLREIRFKRDNLGRIIREEIEQAQTVEKTDYQYDSLSRLIQLSTPQNTLSFSYDKVGRLLAQRQWQIGEKGLADSQMISYRYDKNGNRLEAQLPNQDRLHYHYYGSGHLSAIKYNEQLITEIRRDKQHREIGRTQGALISQFKLDPLGRLEKQLARLESDNPQANLSGPVVERRYQYDRVGNLIQTEDLRTGKTVYGYDKLGQIQLAGQSLFAFDPAHNIIEQANQRIENNQVTHYQGTAYHYDEFGNLSQRIFANGEVQRYEYNSRDQLIKAQIEKPNQPAEIWHYGYDVLGRRISKRSENGKNLQKSFVWDGSHLVQEIDHQTGDTYSYLYRGPNSYEPLAQLTFAKNSQKPTACYYYHNDQIGVPRELTDEQGRLCWRGSYNGWGKLIEEHKTQADIHQPFRLQNQYCDQETGLHYNFFRYYEPNLGRFTSLDPIGLEGGENLYAFAPNMQGWVDPLGLRGITARPTIAYARPAPLRINGRNPINSSYSGSVYELQGSLRGKYPHGVPFNMFGIADFSRYSIKNVNIGTFTTRSNDFRRANELAFGKNNIYGDKPLRGYTWHHDTNGMMRLVPSVLHNSVRHTGGVAIGQSLNYRIGVCTKPISVSEMRPLNQY